MRTHCRNQCGIESKVNGKLINVTFDRVLHINYGNSLLVLWDSIECLCTFPNKKHKSRAQIFPSVCAILNMGELSPDLHKASHKSPFSHPDTTLQKRREMWRFCHQLKLMNKCTFLLISPPQRDSFSLRSLSFPCWYCSIKYHALKCF